jgi:hypothetical protein
MLTFPPSPNPKIWHPEKVGEAQYRPGNLVSPTGSQGGWLTPRGCADRIYEIPAHAHGQTPGRHLAAAEKPRNIS